MSDTMSLSNCEWKEYTLDELFKIQNGYAFKSNDFIDDSPNTFEVLKMGHIERGGGLRRSPKKDFIPRNPKLYNWVLDKNDIVMAMTDMKDNVVILGVPAIIDKSDHYVLNQRVARLKLINEQSANIYFLYYYLKWDDFLLDLQSKANSGVQVNLTTEIIKQSKVIIPSKSIQDVIASILSSLDDKIDLLHRQNATLEKMAETLFRQWFVKEAKEDWEIGKVSDFALHFKDSIQPQKKHTTLYSHYSIPSYDNSKTPIKELGSEIQSNKYKVPAYCILFSKLNPHKDKRVWLLQNEVESNGICSTEFQVVLPKKKQHLYFLYGWLSLNDNYNEIASGVGGTSGSHQRIEPKTIYEYQCPLITDDEVERYNIQIEPVFKKQVINQNQIRTLTALRDNLLPKLMSGEVKVI